MGCRRAAQRRCENGTHVRWTAFEARLPGKGLVLKQVRTGMFYGWRRPVGWLASYALVLHVLLAGVAGGQLTAKAAEQNWSFFEICYGQGGNAGDFSGEVPDKHNSKTGTCVFCAGGGHAAAPATNVLPAPVMLVREVEWTAASETAPAPRHRFSHRQRGPPGIA